MMGLAEELAAKVYQTMPASMPCNSVFAVALVDEALERAAQECEKQVEWAESHPELCGETMALLCVDHVRALKSDADRA
jgi:hypothetical protein